MPAIARSAAVIAARRRVALTNVVVRALPFHCTTEPATKLVPLTTRVNAAPPAFALVGDSEVTAGTGLGGVLMLKVSPPEVPPPGAGDVTSTGAVPAVATSAARTAACSWVLLTKVVARAAPFHSTTEPPTKPLPFTVSANAAAPAFTPVGDSEVTAGSGLALAVMVNVSVPEVPPTGAGVKTVTDAVPAVARSAAVSVVCSWVAPT